MIEAVINAQEKESHVWKKLMVHWESELIRCRLSLEKDQTELNTAKIRGQIFAIKANMRLADAPPIID